MSSSVKAIANLIHGRDGWEEIDPEEIRRFAYGKMVVRLVEHKSGPHWHLESEDGDHPPLVFRDPPSLYERLEELEERHDRLGKPNPSEEKQ